MRQSFSGAVMPQPAFRALTLQGVPTLSSSSQVISGVHSQRIGTRTNSLRSDSVRDPAIRLAHFMPDHSCSCGKRAGTPRSLAHESLHAETKKQSSIEPSGETMKEERPVKEAVPGAGYSDSTHAPEGITQALEARLFASRIMVLLFLSFVQLKYDNNSPFIVRPYRDGGSRPDRMSLFFADTSKNSDIGARQRRFPFPKQGACRLFFAVLQKTVTRMSLLF